MINNVGRLSFWKFNNSPLEEAVFVQSLRENFSLWLEGINFCDDIRIKWDWMNLI